MSDPKVADRRRCPCRCLRPRSSPLPRPPVHFETHGVGCLVVVLALVVWAAAAAAVVVVAAAATSHNFHRGTRVIVVVLVFEVALRVL